MTNWQIVWLILCIFGLFFWMTCGFFLFPLNILFAILCIPAMTPSFIKVSS